VVLVLWSGWGYGFLVNNVSVSRDKLRLHAKENHWVL
jgi:hypothetical protein